MNMAQNEPKPHVPEMAWVLGFMNSHSLQNQNLLLSNVKYKADTIFKIRHIIGVDNNPDMENDAWILNDERYVKYIREPAIRFPVYFIESNSRHYLRGLLDGSGTIHRRKRGGILLNFTHNFEWIVKDIAFTISKHTLLPMHLPKKTDSGWRIQYESRSARIVLWWLYHGDIDHMCRASNREQYLQLVSPGFEAHDQLFQILFGKDLDTIPVKHGKGLYMPISTGQHSGQSTLYVCKSINVLFFMFNIAVQPIFINKGQHKNYVPYFSSKYAESIKMLRPFI